MTKSLIRFSLFLFLISFVGLVGLNRDLDPRRVARIQAHDIIIEITSSGDGELSFNLTANCVSTAMAPSDSCLAEVDIFNDGEGDVTLSAPDIDVTGSLTTCGGGGWFSVSAINLSYDPDDDVIEIGESAGFEVRAVLDIDTPNACQGQSAEILITIEALATDDGDPGDEDEEPNPDPTPRPPRPEQNPPQSNTPIVNQALGATPTPAASSTAVPTPVATITTEVIPQRFPSTGQGAEASAFTRTAETVFAGIGLIAVAMLLFALTLAARSRDEL
jgi:hypothetical protein